MMKKIREERRKRENEVAEERRNKQTTEINAKKREVKEKYVNDDRWKEGQKEIKEGRKENKIIKK